MTGRKFNVIGKLTKQQSEEERPNYWPSAGQPMGSLARTTKRTKVVNINTLFEIKTTIRNKYHD
jgi:hypothetical protein